ncbi:chondroitinase-B domain-containing protein [Gilvimarinus sp. 1_MG-2023]|uniref:chondroitinase-B domain-containing protein n=1 Tax=Gilvimarinus sp. 1_MG-2023 TaxID=3062638 RepID=UPI0026E3D064|nr:chondroitinase-B domain-containing protein [Gilvimarinus sp. 1_MG-2023]MDO6747804.1 chondroitinase-B domain-containing protein [Gilvimarinus sp. 1_MG-2023]
MPIRTYNKLFSLLAMIALTFFSNISTAKIVENIEQFNNAISSLKPGDELVMADGVWENVELVFKAKGLPKKLITLKAQTPGKVIISGQSNLSLSGEYLVVSGLVFKDGFTPTGEVISFRTSNTELANYSRVTNTVIDDFSHPNRNLADLWVAMYGKHNRFDHNSLLNKRNRGVTMAVRLNTEKSEDNHHIIEYNYFGPRQILGANGGETLRVGTSHFSTKYSNTLVQKNFFDRVDGEHEIISSKSSGNVYKNNVIFESQGTLTMRHGHHTTVTGNYIIGNRKPNTGGIRIINEYQTVNNNYLSGLTGKRFRAALVIMNGVPNSPPNRYNQAINAVMENNVVVDSDNINFGAGSDQERTATPIDSFFRHNLIMNEDNSTTITLYDDVSGITYDKNIVNDSVVIPNTISTGFTEEKSALAVTANGLKAPSKDLLNKINFGDVKLPVNKSDVGAGFYPKQESNISFGSGKRTMVAAGLDTLIDAVDNSEPGDVLVLENGKDYLLTKFVKINHPVTILAENGNKPVIRSQKPSFIVIENGGSLKLNNLWFDGAESPDYKGNSVIRTSDNSMNRNYSLLVDKVKVTDLNVNGYFDFFKANPGTFAEQISLTNSQMSNITGSILVLNKETDDLGVYSVENLSILNNTFTDIKAEVAVVYRGGFDESTFGPVVKVENNDLNNVGKGSTHRSGSSMYFHGVQNLTIENTEWVDSAPLKLYLTNGDPETVINNVIMKNTGEIEANNSSYKATNVKYER